LLILILSVASVDNVLSSHLELDRRWETGAGPRLTGLSSSLAGTGSIAVHRKPNFRSRHFSAARN